jgi:beta-N-acetylhexosaminidase
MVRFFWLALALFFGSVAIAQNSSKQQWVDSVFNSLSDDERIAQLMVLRVSEKGGAKGPIYYDDKVRDLIKRFNVGGVCLFQGPPSKQAAMVNSFQSMAKTPVMVCIDGEYGVGMRFDSVIKVPYQITMGAMSNEQLVFEAGKVMGEQCKRIGIHVNYAPVVDVNNNPNNPVINARSFGEDKFKVGNYGIAVMRGMQETGVMACAKHFPGHGDVAVDSHLDLPVINKTRAQLDSLELYPFREVFKSGIGSVMVAHLYIPTIDDRKNRATSISTNNVTNLLKTELGYTGLTFTDALNMKGVAKFFKQGEVEAESIVAGNDMLCLPGDIPIAISKIKEYVKSGKLSWDQVYERTKRVLAAKYDYVLGKSGTIDGNNLTNDLNAKLPQLRRKIAEEALTVVNNDAGLLPMQLQLSMGKKPIAYVGIGISGDNVFAKRMRTDYNADVFYFNYKQNKTRIASMVYLLKQRYNKVVIGVHDYAIYPANNFNISAPAIELLKQLRAETNAVTLFFGNPYALKLCCDGKNLVACYEDDAVFQEAAADLLYGKIAAKGKLPVTICENLKSGAGLVMAKTMLMSDLATAGFNEKLLTYKIDSIANAAIAKKATPGCVVLIAKDGKIVYNKAFGHLNYEATEAVNTETIYDLASVTKITATTVSVMKLYDEGLLDIKKTLGDYLPWVRGTNKENLVIEQVLLHQAGLVSFIPFYKEILNTDGSAQSKWFASKPDSVFTVQVARDFYMRADYVDTMYSRILKSDVGGRKYIYSDNDFIFLGKIVESISGKKLNEYVSENFYEPLGMRSTGFLPLNKYLSTQIAPSEQEKNFRQQLLRGFVHDPGAAMFGGVAGHAGLFSNAKDLVVLYQMLLYGGSFNGQQLLQPATIKHFTSYGSEISRRGLGFDKPEKDNYKLPEPYPCKSASDQTFGHTGFTGTCVWVDPKYNLIYIFLSNRVTPQGGDNTKLTKLNVRPSIQEAIYNAMGIGN